MWKVIAGLFVVGLVLAGGYWFLAGTEPTPSPQPSVDQYAQTATSTATEQTPAPTTPPSAATTNTSSNKIMHATLHTSMGDITIEFFADAAPKTVANFIKLAQSGFYDSTKFHRVIKGFMDQGGDPLTKDDSQKAKWGTGGPGYTIDDEVSPTISHAPGTIAMANTGQPHSAGSQFFINAVNNSASLNGGYTVFGKVTAGMNVVTAINNTSTDSSDRPLTPVVLKSVTVSQ